MSTPARNLFNSLDSSVPTLTPLESHSNPTPQGLGRDRREPMSARGDQAIASLPSDPTDEGWSNYRYCALTINCMPLSASCRLNCDGPMNLTSTVWGPTLTRRSLTCCIRLTRSFCLDKALESIVTRRNFREGRTEGN